MLNDESIWLKLKHKLLDYYITLADIGTEFGLDGSPFYIDQNLSTKLTNLFKDTKITVYVIKSKYPGCHTHPGTKYLSHPWILKFKSIPDIKGAYILTLIDNILSYAECKEGIITGTIRLKNNKNDKLIYDSTTNKFEVGFSESTIYIHSTNYDFLNKKELISICVMLIGTECLHYLS